MGDTPYSASQVERLDSLIDAVNREQLAFVVHVGDITSGRGPCSDEWFAARRAQFARIAHPFILLPGDNDWTDCHREGFEPLERLAKWRSLFCLHPGNFSLKIEVQDGPYCEHVRWQYAGSLFVALDVQGSNNNLGRTKAMDAEYAERMRYVFAWIDDSEKLREARHLEEMVLFMQADPFAKPRRGENGFTPLLGRLRELAAAHPGRIALVHGDGHLYKNDSPIPGLRRVEVYGSPWVAWLKAWVGPQGLQAETAGQY